MEKDGKKKLKHSTRTMMMVIIIVMEAVCAVCISYTSYVHYDKQLEYEAELLRNSAEQSAAVLDMHLKKLEDASVIMLADEGLMSFDAANFSTNTEYDNSQRLAELKKNVTALSIIDNYCDFTLIYRNDAAAGRLSDGTKELMCDNENHVYPFLKNLLGENRRVWVAGINDDQGKVYYISQANDNVLFLGSFYTEELRYLITSMEHIKDSQLLLMDGEKNILDINNTKKEFQIDQTSSDSCVVIGDTTIQAEKTLKNGWTIVLIKDMSGAYEFYKKLELETAVALMLVLILALTLMLINVKDDPAYGTVSSMTPDVDMLTGIINAEEAENIIADKLETCVSGATMMLAIARITNLDKVRAAYGPSGYNGAIIKTYRGLAEFLKTDSPESKNILGRTGEGEFLIMADFTQYDLFKANDALKQGLIDLSEALNSLYLAREDDINICVGASVYPHNSTDYDELYTMAEKALQEAIDDDEKSYAIYKKEKSTHK